jgi:hypothetical protein
MMDMLLLATEGVEGLPPEHIASKLAVPIGILIFAGAVFALLWSNYGAKKGSLILGVAMFGFMGLIGTFWWFGAPGTPVATGLQNFPGQANDAYTAKWYPFEPGSERSESFELWRNLDDFQTIPEFAGAVQDDGSIDETDPFYSSVSGDAEGAAALMIEQYFPRENGSLQIGASFRTELQQATQEVTDQAPADSRFSDWLTEVAGVSEESNYDEEQLYVAVDQGQRVAGAVLETYAVFVDNETGSEVARIPVAETEWFAFKDPGAIWFPSAVWTIASFLLFALCLALLDRIEQREKREETEVEEPMDVQVPIAQ